MSKHRSANEFPSYQEPQPDMPQPEKPKKKHTGLKITAGIAAVLLIAAACTSTDDDEATSSASETTSAQPTDTLTTTGNAPTPDTTTANDPEPTADAPEPETTQDDTPAVTGHTLTFEASTSDGSTGMVTYVAEDFNIVQHSDMAMPWSETVTDITSDWDVIGANMSVQQNGSGEVTCLMTWDGEVVSENTSTGPYSIATCSLPSNL